jgi:N-acetylglutamate synthase-like GNAT family acetyltransferase
VELLHNVNSQNKNEKLFHYFSSVKLFSLQNVLLLYLKIICQRPAQKWVFFYTHIMETTRNNFLISTDKSKLQIDIIHDYLSKQSYWAENIPLETVKRSIKNSMAFGVYQQTETELNQVGFCRVISDLTTFAYLADVFILEEFRGQGLSKFLVETVKQHSDLQGLRRWILATLDAHGLYAQYGFEPLDKPQNFMQIKVVNPYGI